MTSNILAQFGRAGDDVSDDGDDSAGNELVVLNVASKEYSAAIDWGRLESAGVRVVDCVFRAAGSTAKLKRARGLLCRHVIENSIESVEELLRGSVDLEGHRLDPSASTERSLVFAEAPNAGVGAGAAAGKAAPKPEKKAPNKAPARAKTKAKAKSTTASKAKATTQMAEAALVVATDKNIIPTS